MVVRAIALGIEVDEINKLKALYTYDGNYTFVRNYLEWDDSRFLLAFGDQWFNGTYCHEIVNRLRRRHLVKQVFESRASTLPEACRDVIEPITKPKNRKTRRDLEEKLAAVGVTFLWPVASKELIPLAGGG